MAGANALEGDGDPGPVPQAKRPDQARDFASFHNYVALPRSEAFRIEYWALEEAKLQRMPPEKEFSRKIALVVGGSSGIGRETVLELAKRGAHVVVADLNVEGATEVAAEAARLSSPEAVFACALESRHRARACRPRSAPPSGSSAASTSSSTPRPSIPTPAPGTPVEQVWTQALALNVTSNHVLADEAARVLRAQGLPATIVLTSSANAVVPKSGSEPYDVSKTAVNHLIRELAIGLGPGIRVNGIAPATVVAGSSMFPRDRVIGSLKKYSIAFDDSDTTEELRAKLADFYAGADDHPSSDYAGRLRTRDLLARRRRERQDDRPCDSGRRWLAGGVLAVRTACIVSDRRPASDDH